MKPPHLILASDIAGLGKVATTASLPLLAACQVEVAVLPTVLLSSHTGGFADVYVQSYTQGMQAFLQQWQSLSQSFAAMVTGYLRESQQIDLLLEYAKEQQLPLIVDPIMGDNGRLYTGFDMEFVHSMRRLVGQADLVIPNLTEACFLLHRPYPTTALDELAYREICEELHQLGAKSIVLTGLPLADDRIGLAFYDGETGRFHTYQTVRLPHQFFGTGDMVTALLAGAWVQGVSLDKVLPALLDFLQAALQETLRIGQDLRIGVFYQPFLGKWVQQFQTFLEEKNEKEKF